MRETELYEELLKLKSNSMRINLSSSTGKTSIIAIEGVRRKNVLKKIIEIVEKNEAELELLPHGVIQIYFKGDN